jgi:hypothetical protein
MPEAPHALTVGISEDGRRTLRDPRHVHSDETAVSYVRADIAREAIREAFWAGWEQSSEGFNAEYPLCDRELAMKDVDLAAAAEAQVNRFGGTP